MRGMRNGAASWRKVDVYSADRNRFLFVGSSNMNGKLKQLLAERDHVQRTVAEERERLEHHRQQLELAEQSQQLLQVVAQQVQETAHRQIAEVVSKCMRAVFGEESYQFRIDFERKRGKTEARLLFVRDGQEVDPMEAAGGGVLDIASLALRVAAIMLARPRRRRLIVVDEPMRFLSRSNQVKGRDLLETLAHELGFQVILTTHSDALTCGKEICL